jgi:hypothetical protein
VDIEVRAVRARKASQTIGRAQTTATVAEEERRGKERLVIPRSEDLQDSRS